MNPAEYADPLCLALLSEGLLSYMLIRMFMCHSYQARGPGRSIQAKTLLILQLQRL